MRICLLGFLLTATAAFGGPALAPNAPQDKPGSVKSDRIAAFDAVIAPYVAQARTSFPEAKKRFLAGLPRGEVFFVTTRLHDKSGKWEQVFIAVSRIQDGMITGTIDNDLTTVKDYRRDQEYTFPEADLLDWTISKPDGSEEGNFVGKFLDTYKP